MQGFRFADIIIGIAAVAFVFPSAGIASIPQTERDALIAIYQSTDGAHWTNNSGWLGDPGTECSWYGVQCTGMSETVANLRLEGNNLNGTIPPAIGNLSNLKLLSLWRNHLLGTVPSSIGNLLNLTHLILSENEITGSIPKELGNLRNLYQLWMSGNRLSGEIPPDLGNLTGLAYLDLSNNPLGGKLPLELGNLRMLTNLKISNCQLVGSIPAEFGNLYNLQNLALDHNGLTGSIPAELGRCRALVGLLLNDNALAGSIPAALGTLYAIQGLDLSNNHLNGTIPALDILDGNYFDLFDVSGNNLFGEIPSSIMKMRALVRVDVSYNALYAVDADLGFFLDVHNPGWEATQTVAPQGIMATLMANSSLLVSWTPILYTADAGRYELWMGTQSGGPYTLVALTTDKTVERTSLSGVDPTKAYYLQMRTVTDPHQGNYNTVTSKFSAEIRIKSQVDLSLPPGGAATAETTGRNTETRVGYAEASIQAGSAPYGIAVYGYRPADVLISECGIPASSPTTSARVFVDYRKDAAVPGSVGTVDVDTGLALANPGNIPAAFTLTVRKMNGQIIAAGTGRLDAGKHVAKYLWQLEEIAVGFALPATFSTEIEFATLQMDSNIPLSVIAIRLTKNQRGEMLMTSMPGADLTKATTYNPAYFAQFVDGGGYSSSTMLMNTSNVIETGILRIWADNGSPLAVREMGSSSGSTFGYAIEPGGAFTFQTDGASPVSNVGWMEIIPDTGLPAPMGAGLVRFSREGICVAESGISSAAPTTHARIFVDQSNDRQSGIAFGNPGHQDVRLSFQAYLTDGLTRSGSSTGDLTISGKGHAAEFVWQRITGLPDGFGGILDIQSDFPFVPLTIRSVTNERGDFLFTVFPVADFTQPAPTPIVFPQIADGAGYHTECIFLSGGQSSEATLRFINSSGMPLPVAK